MGASLAIVDLDARTVARVNAADRIHVRIAAVCVVYCLASFAETHS
jgi:hypothetical protein